MYLFISGTRIIYDRNFLLQMRNSPVARTPPKNLPLIPGVTCDKEKPQRSAHSHQKQVTKPAESSAVIAEVEKGICSLPTKISHYQLFSIFVCVISSGREETRGASIWNGYLSGMSTKKNAKLTPHRKLSMMPFVDVDFFLHKEIRWKWFIFFPLDNFRRISFFLFFSVINQVVEKLSLSFLMMVYLYANLKSHGWFIISSIFCFKGQWRKAMMKNSYWGRLLSYFAFFSLFFLCCFNNKLAVDTDKRGINKKLRRNTKVIL